MARIKAGLRMEVGLPLVLAALVWAGGRALAEAGATERKPEAPAAPPAATLTLHDIVAGLEKAEKAWRDQKSWMLRYVDAREAINFSRPFVHHPHEVTNARKGDWLFARVAPITEDANSNRVWVLWRDGKYTQRLGDGVSANTKEEVLETPGIAGMLYSIWWYPNHLGIDLVTDAYPSKSEAPPSVYLARYLKANEERFRVRENLEVVDTVPCHVVEWEGRVVYWIDPAAGFGVVRRTEIQPMPGGLANEYKAFRFREHVPGIWLPDRQVTVTFTGGVGEQGSRVEKVLVNTLEEARFNDLPDDLFRVPTSGLKVFDKDAKKDDNAIRR